MSQLYDYFRSSAAYRVRIALGLKKLSVEQIAVNLKPEMSEQNSAEYRAINSQGRVPTWQEGEFLLGQSVAILEYLEERYPDTPLLPCELQSRARVRQMSSLIACDIHPLNNLSVLKYLKEHLNADSAAINDWYRHWIVTGFSALEDLIDETHLFCFGDQPTFADVYLIPQMYNARRFNVDLVAFPKLVKIDQRCTTLSAFVSASPENQADNV